ncbi:HAD family hydrolase [Puia dinghuensis]|uniref:Phosphatase n=1 Tax=Puia dinghuensis TaxID=1792502 RepID=A0A8J2XTX3_9BACT|nr:HAD family hydrolase [Puia dinghuensis]GGB07429.1 phosphatase [Puia dinghuensis]
MSSIQLVVFDIAGTTVQDSGSVAEAFISAFRDFGFEIPQAEVKKVMGFRKIDAIALLLETFAPAKKDDDILIDRIHTRFIDTMIAFYRDDEDLAPFPYAEQVFSALKQQGIKVALNTGFTRSITDTILHRLRWDDRSSLIDMVICSDEVSHGRPYADMIETLINVLGVSSPSNVLKIGDTEVDVEEGRNASCGKVVSVTTGAYTREQLEPYHPDFIIDDLRELLPIIEKA